MNLKRRALLQGMMAGMWMPKLALATAETDRKFLFLLCNGGWDPTFVFTPELPDTSIWTPSGEIEQANGIVFRDSNARPTVSTFFQNWGHLTAIINGVEVRSITHEACRRIILTGASQTDGDDWASIIGGHSTEWLLPSLVVSCLVPFTSLSCSLFPVPFPHSPFSLPDIHLYFLVL